MLLILIKQIHYMEGCKQQCYHSFKKHTGKTFAKVLNSVSKAYLSKKEEEVRISLASGLWS